MRGVAFEKYEGLGNDFLVVAASAIRAARFDLDEVRALCDRRFGVGGDGVLVVETVDRRRGADLRSVGRMRVHNADGSIPEMCGNGLRCVALALVRQGAAPHGEPFFVDTDAGPRRCVVTGDASADSEGRLASATVDVDMGLAQSTGPLDLVVAGERVHLETVSTGNPHAVHFGVLTEAEIDRLGPAIATHSAFPEGVNAGFATLTDGGIDLVVWERGVGRTLACGTGACAAVFAACSGNALPFGVPLSVRLPGGHLVVTVDADGRAEMRGPARLVYRGTLT